MTLTFTLASDLCIVGRNPEMADYGNPRGDIFGLAYYVVASNDHGDTWNYYVPSKLVGENMVAGLTVRMAAGKLPVGFSRLWHPGRAIYGSDAYVAYGQAEDVALEAREAADEAWM